jgi:hypothetical protein
MPLRKESLKVSKILVLSRSGMPPTVVKILPIDPVAADREANRPRPLPDFDKDRTVGSSAGWPFHPDLQVIPEGDAVLRCRFSF